MPSSSASTRGLGHVVGGKQFGLVILALMLIAFLHNTGDLDSAYPALAAAVNGTIIISSCDDLPDKTSLRGTVTFDGYIRCDETKMIEVAEGAEDIIFVSHGWFHVRGLRFSIREGTAMYFHGDVLAFEKTEGNVEVFDVEGEAYFMAHDRTFLVKPGSMSPDASSSMIRSSPGAIVEVVEGSAARFTPHMLVVTVHAADKRVTNDVKDHSDGGKDEDEKAGKAVKGKLRRKWW